MDLGIAGKTAMVCASSRGLGRGCADALAEAGCDLVINGRNEAALEEAARQIRDTFAVKVMAVAADISTAEGQGALLSACPAPDILVTNGGGPPPRDFWDLTREAMMEGIILNMIAPIELIQRVIDPMVERGFGRVVNITSLAVLQPFPGVELSSGARAGLTSFLAGVGRAVARHNVTINNILPYKFATERIRSTIAFAAQTARRSMEEQAALHCDEIPARRFGSRDEFGKACAFLCSAHAGYITGQNLRMDGGFHQSAF